MLEILVALAIASLLVGLALPLAKNERTISLPRRSPRR
jgi:type II secretory pathway pseudopilin PulG